MVELYRLLNGKFPAKAEDVLGERLPRVPADPFDGRPLRFKPDGKDLVLYSVGVDGVDDGGVMIGDGRAEGDIVFRLRGR
jgi:hypothetical protein